MVATGRLQSNKPTTRLTCVRQQLAHRAMHLAVFLNGPPEVKSFGFLIACRHVSLKEGAGFANHAQGDAAPVPGAFSHVDGFQGSY